MAQAGNKRAIKAGSAFIEFSLKDGKLRKGLKQMSRRLKAVGSLIARIGAGIKAASLVIVGAMTAAALSFAKLSDAIGKVSAKLGILPGELQKLQFAASLSGVTIETLNTALQRMVRRISEVAATGSGAAAGALRELGLDAHELAQLSPEEQLKRIADAMMAFPDGDRVRLAMAIFDTEGVGLVNLFRDGAAGIERLAAEFERLGLMIDAEDIKNATKLADAWAIMQRQLKMIVTLIGSAVAKDFAKLLKLTQETAAAVLHWIKDNRELVRTVAKVAIVVGTLGGALVATGLWIHMLGLAVGGFAKVLGVLMAAVGLLFNPLTWIVGIIGAGVVVFLKFTEVGRATADVLMEKFGAMGAFFQTTLGAIYNALLSGDLAAAGDVAMAALNVVWAKSLELLTAGWTGAWNAVLDTIDFALAKMRGALVAWENFQAKINQALFDGFWAYIDFFAKNVVTIIEWLTRAVLGVVGAIVKAFDSTLQMFDDVNPFVKQADYFENKNKREARAKWWDDQGAATQAWGDEKRGNVHANTGAIRNRGRGETRRDMGIRNRNHEAFLERQRERRERRREKRDKRVAEATENLAEKMDAWRNKVDEAESKKPKPGTPEYYAKEAAGGGGGAAAAIAQRGISNARAIQSLQGATVTWQERMLRASERTARNTANGRPMG